MQPYEVIEAASLEVMCEGSGGVLGHPRVYLHIDQDSGQITCPYCSRQYVLGAAAAKHAGGH